jgi:hypothetical protein
MFKKPWAAENVNKYIYVPMYTLYIHTVFIAITAVEIPSCTFINYKFYKCILQRGKKQLYAWAYMF